MKHPKEYLKHPKEYYQARKLPIPFLEITLGFFSIYAAILFFLDGAAVFSNIQSDAAAIMSAIMPGAGWGIVFLVAGAMISFGLVGNIIYVRMGGICINVITFAVLAYCHAYSFPNLTFGIFFFLSITSIGALFTTKTTEL